MTAGKISVVLLLTFLTLTGWAQKNKTQLQRERQKNLEKIKETEKILDETSKKKKHSIGELSALNERISQQENLITTIRSEIDFLEEDIRENNGIITTLEKDLSKLKKEFEDLLFEAQKANDGVNKLTFLFSSKSFDEMLMRLKYMEQYSQARKEQAAAIQMVQGMLSKQVVQIETKKAEKDSLLNNEVAQNDQLVSLKKQKRGVVKALEKEEKSLRSDLEDTRRAVAKLDKMINDLVREELARAEREKKAATRAGKAPESTLLSNNFEENKNKFAWPVHGFVSQKFGRQNHPVLKGIVLQNDGINIQTTEGETVKSIHEGEVRKVAFIPAIGNSVIINHGEYFSVYSGLKDVYVKMGQKVSPQQDLGILASNGEGVSELRFQIRKNIEPLNPEDWLAN